MLKINLDDMTFKHEFLLPHEVRSILLIAKDIIACKPIIWDSIYIKTWFRATSNDDDNQIYFLNQSLLITRFLLTVINYYELQLRITRS